MADRAVRKHIDTVRDDLVHSLAVHRCSRFRRVSDETKACIAYKLAQAEVAACDDAMQDLIITLQEKFDVADPLAEAEKLGDEVW